MLLEKIKKCTKCEEVKEINNFHKLNSKFSKSKYSRVCKECKQQTDAAYYKRNRIKIISKNQEYYCNNRERIAEQGKVRYNKRVEDSYLSILLQSCRGNARKRNREFSLTKELIIDLLKKQDNKCYYSGEELSLDRKLFNTVSVDRVDPQKGYTEDNVVLCCYRVNVVKNNLTHDDFVELCTKISKNMEGKKWKE